MGISRPARLTCHGLELVIKTEFLKREVSHKSFLFFCDHFYTEVHLVLSVTAETTVHPAYHNSGCSNLLFLN